MISHNIIINKPKVSAFFPPVTSTPFEKMGYSGVLANQEVYEKYLNAAPARKGMFVKLKYTKSDELTGIQIHYVLDVITDHKKVPFIFDRGHPKPFRLLQCSFNSNIDPWNRLESMNDFVPLTPDEVVKYTTVFNDQLQDYIKAYEQAPPQ